jgi:hypothetical protein
MATEKEDGLLKGTRPRTCGNFTRPHASHIYWGHGYKYICPGVGSSEPLTYPEEASTSIADWAFAAITEPDMVNHPPHYGKHPSGVECITIIEHMTFNLGSAIKYLWREGLKGNSDEDLHKAIWYINREIEKRARDDNAK